MPLDFEYQEKHIGHDIKAYYQNELNLADEIHNDECGRFKERIAELVRLVNLQNKIIINQQKELDGER